MNVSAKNLGVAILVVAIDNHPLTASCLVALSGEHLIKAVDYVPTDRIG